MIREFQIWLLRNSNKKHLIPLIAPKMSKIGKITDFANFLAFGPKGRQMFDLNFGATFVILSSFSISLDTIAVIFTF